MDLIDTGSETIVIPGVPTKFKQGTTSKLRKVTDHKVEDNSYVTS